MTSRRTFLKVGLGAAAILAIGGGIYRAVHPPVPGQRFVLDGEAKAVLEAIVPVILAGAMPSDGAPRAEALARTVGHVNGAILGLPLATQKEVQDLFGLLALGPARRLLTGVPDGWASARPEDVQAFLQSWRLHRLAMLQAAYAALHDLVMGGWYADPASWAAIGYPGPIKELS